MTVTGKINTGKCSWFGGPEDQGVSPSEGLAFIYEIAMAPDLFLDEQPAGTTGLARRLDPEEFFVAMRWDYNEISKEDLLRTICIVRSPDTARAYWARPADWGPHSDTDRICDISYGLMQALGVETDDELEIVVIPPRDEVLTA